MTEGLSQYHNWSQERKNLYLEERFAEEEKKVKLKMGARERTNILTEFKNRNQAYL